MSRKCIKLNIEPFIEGLHTLTNTLLLELYVDEENKDEIFAFIKNNRDKFRRILIEIIENRYNDLLYRKEKVNSKLDNLTAMKFVNKQRRIYCKEYINESSGKKIIMLQILVKKSQGIDNKLRRKVKKFEDWNYEFE